MMDMGHGDELVIGDGNFPVASLGIPVVYLNGHGVPEVLDAILELMPLDRYVQTPWTLMEVIKGDTIIPEDWEKYTSIIQAHGCSMPPETLERCNFYSRSKQAFCVVATSEIKQYANIILTKGIVI
jgi:L-fucose mutarotase